MTQVCVGKTALITGGGTGIGQAAIGDSGRLDFGINSAGVTGEDDLQKTGDYATETFDHVITIDYLTFGSIESDRQEVQRLQQAQLEYGVYACIPGTQGG